MSLMMPKRVKYRKFHLAKLQGLATRGNTVGYGEFGLQATEPGWISDRALEAGRIAISHFLGNEGRIWIRVFPHRNVSSKPLEVRMGCGKGEPEFWAAEVKPGTMIYEVGGVPEEIAREALNRAAHKMSVTTRFARRRQAI